MTSMTGDDIVALSKKHTISEWAAQGAVDPIPVSRAQGVYFWTPEGKRFIDFNSQLMCVNIGHGNPRVIEAIQRQTEAVCYVTPSGMTTEARARLEQLCTIARDRWVSSVTLALVHRALGEISECLGLLEKAVEQREVSVSLIAMHPVYDSLRGERRFQALLRKMGLPETAPPRRGCS